MFRWNCPSCEYVASTPTQQRAHECEGRAEWLIFNRANGQFWGPDSRGYFGLWGAGLYTEARARRLASDKDRADQVHHITEYRDQIGNMRGAYARLAAALIRAEGREPSASELAEPLVAPGVAGAA